MDLTAGLVISGELLDRGTGGVLTHHYPATGAAIGEVVLGGGDEIEAAVSAARTAGAAWEALGPTGRRDALWKLGEVVASWGADFERVGRLELGMPVRSFAWRQQLSLEWIRTYATYATKVGGAVTASTDDGRLEYTRLEPYGVVGVIITWNSPLLSLCMKVPAALAAGNTVVIKPSELTPYTPVLFARACAQAGIPAGVVNVVTGGAEAGEALVRHPDVEKISFTGGERTASAMMRAGADLIKPFCFELGGKSAYVVFDDADIDQVVRLASGELSNAGQSCKFGSRLLVSERRSAELIDALVGAVRGVEIGDPAAPTTHMGPLATHDAQQRVLGFVEDARSRRDGELVLGGSVPDLPEPLSSGYYVAPAIFAGVDPASRLGQEEIFGPVYSVIPFGDVDEAISLANATRFGLSAYIHTSDVRRAHHVAASIKAGTVYVNDANRRNPEAPFGGYRASGLGREGGRAGLDEFLRMKTIGIA